MIAKAMVRKMQIAEGADASTLRVLSDSQTLYTFKDADDFEAWFTTGLALYEDYLDKLEEA